MIQTQPADNAIPKIKASVCPFDCADTCNLNIQVKDNEILRVKGYGITLSLRENLQQGLNLPAWMGPRPPTN